LDVSENTPSGYAPNLDVSGFRAGTPILIRLEGGAPRQKVVEVIELEDALFRTESAVVLPRGENPEGAGSDPSVPRPDGVAAVAATLRHMADTPGKKLLVAGHTSTAPTCSSRSSPSAARGDRSC
jgi:hypothetical protein